MRVLTLEEMLQVGGGTSRCGSFKLKFSCWGKGSGKRSGKGSGKSSGKCGGKGSGKGSGKSSGKGSGKGSNRCPVVLPPVD
ncbi:hypothetical protein [Hydrogenophaga sp.]|uniref:hypothetical protein n=1 Tax=Hydrogenophaga sp. TaxID=1904254 RepID=UPI0035622C93